MSKGKLLRYFNYVLWATAVLLLAVIVILNMIPTDSPYPPLLSPLLSYGVLFFLACGMLTQTLRRRKLNHSDTAFFLKFAFVLLFYMIILIAFINEIIKL